MSARKFLPPTNGDTLEIGSSAEPIAYINAVVVKKDGADVATLASPTFTGTVTVPTADGADNSTKAANTSWVRSLVAGISFGTLGGLASGVLAWLQDPTSAKLRAAVTDETGTGSLVFANTPTLTTPVLGTPTSGTLTNCTVALARARARSFCFADRIKFGSISHSGLPPGGMCFVSQLYRNCAARMNRRHLPQTVHCSSFPRINTSRRSNSQMRKSV